MHKTLLLSVWRLALMAVETPIHDKKKTLR